MWFKSILLTIFVFAFVACTPTKDQVAKMLKDNPEMVTDVIKTHPKEFIQALNVAVKSAQQGERADREKEERAKFEKSFKNPMQPLVRKDENIRGPKDAPLTLIEYSDFECPFCKRGYTTVNALMEKYKGKIRFIYKHLPLSFHPNAMPASKYYEAIRLQSNDKASEFHDMLFDEFDKIKLGEKFFKSIAKRVGANMARLAKDLDSPKVMARIQEDLKEAEKFDFKGTPGFLLNGIPVKGAYPPAHFDSIIEELKKRGMLKL